MFKFSQQLKKKEREKKLCSSELGLRKVTRLHGGGLAVLGKTSRWLEAGFLGRGSTFSL